MIFSFHAYNTHNNNKTIEKHREKESYIINDLKMKWKTIDI